MYTAQGFEPTTWAGFFGRDLVYDAGSCRNRKISHDSVVKKAPEAEFVHMVKQKYRVLLSRGMMGCYVFLEDFGTRDFFFSRMKSGTESAAKRNGSSTTTRTHSPKEPMFEIT